MSEDKYIFLLGGHDLEMCAIKELLQERNIRYFDASLCWENAKTSAYKKELELYGEDEDGVVIYGIELQEDIVLPRNYKAIDHHNCNRGMPSALEQVALLLGVELNRFQVLVAANDKGSIAEMKKVKPDVTNAEIAEIRSKDRKAQGVTERDELLAEMAIANSSKRGSLKMVKALSSKFSPICDRMYPYENLLIYMDDRWCFYGRQAEYVRKLFPREESNGYLYYGGGENGFVGLKNGVVSTNCVQMMVDKISKEFFCSYHVFYFPFKWKLRGRKQKLFSEQVDLEGVPISDCAVWKRVQLDRSYCVSPENNVKMKEDCELFGERQYFLEFVHPVLYDIKGEPNPILYHYERKEPQMRLVEYHITLSDRTYTLKVDAINLNLYATGVGILSFFLKNDKQEQWDPDSVLNINQFGRRIMPPHSNEFFSGNRGMLAQSISISGLEGDEQRYKDCFDYKIGACENERGLHSVWSPAIFITNLIADLSPELRITPIIDDRMIVNCWYANDQLAQEVVHRGSGVDSPFMKDDFWYQYVFVDKQGDVTCQNVEMKKELLKDSTYFRWQKYGSLYGISRYSLVLLTGENDFAEKVLSMHMRTIYSRMLELVIIQRASLLRFSDEVTKVSCLKVDRNVSNVMIAKRIGSMYKEYIRFVNQIYFRNVTAQDQGIEMYNMLLKQFDSGAQIKDLDEEIEELYQYITLLVDQRRNENSENLNKLAAIFLPATVLTGIFGMNPVEDLECDWGFWIHISIIVVLSLLCYRFIKTMGNPKK